MKMAYTHVVLAVAVSLKLLTYSSAQDANCDYQQNVVQGVTYYVYSPNYSGNYPPGKTCRWRATCPTGQVCRLTCGVIQIPATSNCEEDRLLISRTGDDALQGADRYCGTGQLNVTSVNNKISIGFVSSTNSKAYINGGKFYCTLYSESSDSDNSDTCSCGWKKNTKIVGGQETGVNEYPMMVALIEVSSRSIYCGATIISRNYVLTAAHCLDNQAPSNVDILYGEHNIKMSSSTRTLIHSESFKIHPNFNGNRNYDYDIGLVKAKTAIVFGQLIGPACLPFRYSGYSFEGTYVEALGWGSTSFTGADSDYLQKVYLKITSQTSCRNALNYAVTERQMCTFEDGKDACQNDSGGPLLWQDPSTNLVHLVGIISFGQACATNVPGVNTRVSEFLNWIQANTPGESYCYK